MTTDKESILGMEPGIKLDELVAEHVMNIPVTAKRKRFEWVHVPPYSSDIAFAWKVEELMNTDDRFWRYTHWVKKILLSQKDDGVNEYDMMHAPADVRCKAALKVYFETNE